MRNRYQVLVIIGLFLIIVYSTRTLFPAQQTRSQEWKQTMEMLAEVLSELLPVVASPEVAKSENEWEHIRRNARQLARLAHNVDEQTTGPSLGFSLLDPAIGHISGLMKREARRAYEDLDSGNRGYSLNRLRGVTGYCIACHTQSGFLGNESLISSLNSKILSLHASQRARYFAATMQFDPALEEFEGVIADSTLAKTHYFEWRDAVRWALVIAVRKNKDPERALRIVRQLLRQPSTSFDLREFAQAWEESLLEWKADLATQVRVGKLLSEARRLIGKANVIQRYPADHTGDVYLLRALGKIDDLLRSTTTEKAVGEALLLAGQASEVLAFPKIWPVHEVYYEACIRRSPHTDLAGKCYRCYEAAIYYGYSGSGGVFIPDAIRELLSELRKLAQVAPQEEARP